MSKVKLTTPKHMTIVVNINLESNEIKYPTDVVSVRVKKSELKLATENKLDLPRLLEQAIRHEVKRIQKLQKV